MYSKASKSLLSVRPPVATASGKCTLLMETATSTNERTNEGRNKINLPLTATERGTSNEKTGRRTLVPFVSGIGIAQPRIKSRSCFRGGEREGRKRQESKAKRQ